MDNPVEVARALIAIDSVNPSLVADAAGESTIADYCTGWLVQRGFEVTRLEATPGRPTIVAVSRGTGGGASIMLNGHLDTVAATASQLVPQIVDGALRGRGAFDTKGGVAALMVAASRAVASSLRGDILVTLVADEEFGSLGTEEVLASFTADAAIVAEPSDLHLTVAHRGFAWFRLDITGHAAHGSMPEQGVDAISHAARVMAALDELRGELESAAPHPYLAPGTVRVATITGGTDAATVAASCSLTIERRFLPGETPDSVEAELRRVIESVEGAAGVELVRVVARGAFEADTASVIVSAVADSAREVLGEVRLRGEPFWTDAGLIAEAGIPCVVIGVAGGGAHADEEWATTESIEQLAEIVERAIVRFCS
ncbi:ArgE/DapE family deacylase [soil metagenome]